jgi:hypothetical protein
VQIQVVSQAVEIAEDVTANYFKLSTAQWRHVRYDIRTLAELDTDEVIDHAFAQIIRYSRKRNHGERWYDYFKICLQDHNIISAAERDQGLQLLPLTLYVVTHELVHVVRFCKFLQSFDAVNSERRQEEMRVHEITHKALENVKLPHLEYVLKTYRNYQFIEELKDHEPENHLTNRSD